MSLKAWSEAGWIRETPVDPELIGKLLARARDNLQKSQLEGLGADWQLIIAYTAILNAASAALMAAGYRADRDQHHYRTLQSLEHTIGLEASILSQLDWFRKKRHTSTYDTAGSVSDQEVQEITSRATSIVDAVICWMKTAHPDVMTSHPESD